MIGGDLNSLNPTILVRAKMRFTTTILLCASLFWIAVPTTQAFAESLPVRATPIPQTTDGVPHVLIGVKAVPELSEMLQHHVAQFPGVNIGATRV
jgi:hypothetical protein